MFRTSRDRQRNYGVILLAYHLLNSDYIPPVTLGTILFQIIVFLGFIPALDHFKIPAMCLLPSRIISQHEWLRLFASLIMHADDMHLYYNMISFLWKGRRLETRFGSRRFFILLMTFCISTSICMVALSYLVEVVFGFRSLQLMKQCAVGFSGVIFALKVLHNNYFPDSDSVIFGWFPVSSRYGCWVELFLIQMVTPNASFIGHLAGIIVGLLYLNGPLKLLTDFIDTTALLLFGQRNGSHYNGYRNSGSSTTHGRQNFFEYTGGMTEEEQLRYAREESLRGNRYPSAPPYPDSFMS
uniref:Rhomboid domain-containing protein n=1 Tax=Syphacia muris TaxID=451379 RepID=A0A0N5AFU8_9BILA